MGVSNRAFVIGASDMQDLLDIAPYGCQRRLYFKYNGEEPTNEIDDAAMRRGKDLEPLIMEDYLKEFKVLEYDYQLELEPLVIHDHVISVHPDLVTPDYVVELKTKSSKYMPLNEGYYYQVNLQQWFIKEHWGTLKKGQIYILNIDTWDYELVEVAYNEDAIVEIFEKVKYFNKKLPPRKEWGYSGCKNCQFFDRCWIDDIKNANGTITATSYIEFKINQYVDAKLKVKEATKKKEAVEKEIVTFLLDNKKETVITAEHAFSLKRNKKSITLKEEKI